MALAAASVTYRGLASRLFRRRFFASSSSTDINKQAEQLRELSQHFKHSAQSFKAAAAALGPYTDMIDPTAAVSLENHDRINAVEGTVDGLTQRISVVETRTKTLEDNAEASSSEEQEKTNVRFYALAAAVGAFWYLYAKVTAAHDKAVAAAAAAEAAKSTPAEVVAGTASDEAAAQAAALAEVSKQLAAKVDAADVDAAVKAAETRVMAGAEARQALALAEAEKQLTAKVDAAEANMIKQLQTFAHNTQQRVVFKPATTSTNKTRVEQIDQLNKDYNAAWWEVSWFRFSLKNIVAAGKRDALYAMLHEAKAMPANRELTFGNLTKEAQSLVLAVVGSHSSIPNSELLCDIFSSQA